MMYRGDVVPKDVNAAVPAAYALIISAEKASHEQLSVEPPPRSRGAWTAPART